MMLVLFDIDGTLLRTNGAGRTALARALSSLTDRPISTDGVSFSGRTDPAIFKDVLTENGLSPTEALLQQAIERYVETMQSTLSTNDVTALPQVADLLATLEERSDVQLGLVTGNVKPVAYEKLAMTGLTTYFPFGGFGSDHADRAKLPSIAAQRASSYTGHSFHPSERTVIIGDTVHDIHCGQTAGARVVAVCTGRYERDTLASHAPDLLLDTLPPTDAFLNSLFAS